MGCPSGERDFILSGLFVARPTAFHLKGALSHKKHIEHKKKSKTNVINGLIIIFADLTVLFVMPEDLNRASILD
jgi:hypothetical protein